MEIHEVPGSHTEVLREPHVRVWAERLNVLLDNAQQRLNPRNVVKASRVAAKKHR